MSTVQESVKKMVDCAPLAAVWAEQLTQADISEESIGDLVHDAFSGAASDVNNRGLQTQLLALLTHYGPLAARSSLEDVLGLDLRGLPVEVDQEPTPVYVFVAVNFYGDLHTHMTPRVFTDLGAALAYVSGQVDGTDQDVRLKLLLTEVGQVEREARLLWRYDGDRTEMEGYNDTPGRFGPEALQVLREAGFVVPAAA